MNKFCSLLALFYVCLAVCLVACSGGRNKTEFSPETKHYLWKISDENSSVWVLGSIHLASSAIHPFDPVIDSAFAHANELAVELNMNDEEVVNEVNEQSSSQGTLQDKSLREVLPTDLWNSVDSICRAWDVPMDEFENMRPWLVATTLSSYAFIQAGLTPEYGVDYVLLNRAMEEGKVICALETAKEQVNAVADTTKSDSAGIYYLRTTLREIAGIDSIVTNLMQAWKTGNDDLLRQILGNGDDEDDDSLSDDKRFKDEYEQRVYLSRNAKMAESIMEFLNDDRNIFVVVGVAHLALEKNNVIDILKSRGFTVERF